MENVLSAVDVLLRYPAEGMAMFTAPDQNMRVLQR